MRELTADMFISLDSYASGAAGGQDWTSGHFGPQFAAFAQQVLAQPQISEVIERRLEPQANTLWWSYRVTIAIR